MTTAPTTACRHSGARCGYRATPFYPEQEKLKPGEMWCYDCESVIPDPIVAARRHAAAQPCLRRHQGGCWGTVTARASFAGTGRTIYECEHHLKGSFEREQANRERYPAQAPNDFDPLYAGESW